MKRLPLILIALVLLAMPAGPAGANGIPIGTLTGSGTVTLDSHGNPTGYSFTSAFSWVPALAGPTAMNDLGQYVFAANSLGTLPVYDYSAALSPAPPVYTSGSNYMGAFQFDLNTTRNGGAHSSTLYGSILNFTFQGTEPSGNVTGAIKSDGFLHWYYGFDSYVGPPAGKTSLAAWGVSDIFNFAGTYQVTQFGGQSETFNLNGTLYATPLPSTVLLLGSGLAGLAFWRKRRSIVGKG
jgi:hypothetical protein